MINRRMLRKVMPATRSPTPSSAPLLGTYIVIGTVLDVGAMFRLQKSYLSLEPFAPSFDDRGRGGAAVAIRSVA